MLNGTRNLIIPLLFVYIQLEGVDTVVTSAPSNIPFKTVNICLTILYSVFRVRLIGCMQLVQLAITRSTNYLLHILYK
jgi:hypothetical protein